MKNKTYLSSRVLLQINALLINSIVSCNLVLALIAHRLPVFLADTVVTSKSSESVFFIIHS